MDVALDNQTRAGPDFTEGERAGSARPLSRGGDLQALYRAQAGFVRRAVLRLGGPSCEADDLVHEVFLVALRKERTLAEASAPRAWLYAVAVRVVSAARRRAKVRRLLGLGERLGPAEEQPTPLRAFEQQEAARRVYRALEGMAEKKRTVFILHELEGLTGAEIAAVLGCPLKTVWSRLGHARLAFSAHLRREERAGPSPCSGAAGEEESDS